MLNFIQFQGLFSWIVGLGDIVCYQPQTIKYQYNSFFTVILYSKLIWRQVFFRELEIIANLMAI